MTLHNTITAQHLATLLPDSSGLIVTRSGHVCLISHTVIATGAHAEAMKYARGLLGLFPQLREHGITARK